MTPVKVALACIPLLAAALFTPVGAADALPSWNEGATKSAIVEFVGRVTKKGGPDYVPPARRVATFDMDGTLLSEQPAYAQLVFALDRVKALAPQRPEWKDTQPFASLLKGDVKGALAGGERALLEIVVATHTGMTTDEFDKTVQDWLAAARHPRFKQRYDRMVFQPMLEVLRYLRANGFKTYVVTGSGVEYARAFAERAFGIPPEQVIGSFGKQRFEMRAGKPVLVKLPELHFENDNVGKPVAIHRAIGRRPIAAFGNSDGDLAMLQWTCAAGGARLCLYVHHTDGERETAYDRASDIGRLDKGLDEARARGWAVADIKRDWKVIFPWDKGQ